MVKWKQGQITKLDLTYKPVHFCNTIKVELYEFSVNWV